MKNSLQKYFPIIRSREEILAEIEGKAYLKKQFYNWSEENQKEFLDFCSGVKGVKILYDAFFKEIMSPEFTPERLNDFLSLLLKQDVKILHVLPNDSTRLAAESTLLVTDIVVELEDHSIADVEVQKIGYRFPGQRCACYSADLLLRQYKRVREHSKKKQVYGDIRDVYTIVLFEKSPREFKVFPDTYVHFFEQKSDSGLEIDLLQKYCLIPLDIFRESHQNKPIRNRLEAWLAFFSEDKPERVIELAEAYPEFKEIYRQVYGMCRNVEDVMGLFSEELLELDRNTTQYMMDEMQKEINEGKKVINQIQEELSRSQEELSRSQEELSRKNEELERKERQYQELLRRVAELEKKK